MKTFLLLLAAITPLLPVAAQNAAAKPEAAELAALEQQLKASPDSLRLLSAAGDAALFAGQAARAVEHFERMIKLDPAQDAPHWRLGIAYYFNQQWAESSRQFAKYHAHDGRDRENGIWKFLADAKGNGLERARAEMLAYHVFAGGIPRRCRKARGDQGPAREVLRLVLRRVGSRSPGPAGRGLGQRAAGGGLV
jgi:tetratricopeptide (TPR) repeat protein